jgi:hypothetical protein
LWIKFSSTEDEFEAAIADWQVSYKFPCAIGALDCTHIPNRIPSVHGDEYINRKGFPSINVQATCNSRELFASVDVSWLGSVHDARIWRNSDTYRTIRENTWVSAMSFPKFLTYRCLISFKLSAFYFHASGVCDFENTAGSPLLFSQRLPLTLYQILLHLRQNLTYWT